MILSAEALRNLGAAGPILLLLAVLSLVSLTLIAVKSAQLWSVVSGRALRAEAIESWRKGQHSTAPSLLAAGRAPADRVTRSGMEEFLKGSPEAAVSAEMHRLGTEEVQAMNRNIRLLELIAMISPLLGLLGTVLGMIQSFQQLELAQGAANASVLAGGIWQALLTTAAGLLVAIPAAVAASLLSGRVDAAAVEIETAAGRLLAMADAGT